jgi:hypothetical protein
MGPQCGSCGNQAVIVDNETRSPWCLGCALDLIKAGCPVTEYMELAGGAMYTTELARGTSSTLRFR